MLATWTSTLRFPLLGRPARAGCPRGVVGHYANTYTNSTGLWLYPPMVWDSCGGACGGAVACTEDIGGVSACGVRGGEG